MYKVVGLREEKYIGQEVSGHNCDFEYTDTEMIRHVILLVQKDTGQKVELTLSETQGECGSGWCTASWGESEFNEVETFAGKTHTLKQEFLVDVKEGMYDFKCELFSVDYDGGCEYYPFGGYSVNLEAFEEVWKGKLDKRPVHIFHGDSNSCKSHLAALTGRTIFETDSVPSKEHLPKVLTQEIIVVGNRWKCDLQDIKHRLFGECEIIEVSFKTERA